MKIAIGGDPNALLHKEALIRVLEALHFEYKDFGSADPIYANVAIEVAECVASSEYDRGILLCGTGIGVSIAANKVKGAYAALVNSIYAAEKAITSNRANILCIGALTTGLAIAENILKVFLSTEYKEATPSAEKVACYVEYDKNK